MKTKKFKNIENIYYITSSVYVMIVNTKVTELYCNAFQPFNFITVKWCTICVLR